LNLGPTELLCIGPLLLVVIAVIIALISRRPSSTPARPGLPRSPVDDDRHQTPRLLARFFRKLYDFTGRAGRLEFSLYSLLVPSALLVLMTGSALIIAPELTAEDPISDIGAALWILLSLPIVLAAGSRRLHDFSWPGWPIVLAFVPLLNLPFLLALFLLPGKKPPADV
jgi:uncharacterized membrane protein YhaH (DUF805 family)